MHIETAIRTFCLVLSVWCSVVPAVAASDEEILQHDVATTKKIMVAMEGAYACDQPQENSSCRPIGRGVLRRLLDRDRAETQLKAETWLRIPSIYDGAVSWWIPRKFVIFYSEIHAFSGDWPIRYYYFASGNSSVLIDFSSDGSFNVKEYDGNSGKSYQINGRVYGSDGYYQLRFPDRASSGVTSETFSYDIKNPRAALKKCDYRKRIGEFCAIGLFADPPRPVLDPRGKCLRDCKSKQ